MATTGQNYAVGIGTGAAGGAAAGSAILPGWGTAIGAGVGAIGGAISAGVANAKEADQKAHMLAAQQRDRKQILIELLRNQAAKAGLDTTALDTQTALKGQALSNASEDAQFAAAHRIDPQAFVSMAQLGTQAAGRTYNGLKAPSAPQAPGQNGAQTEPFGGNVQLKNPELGMGGPRPDDALGNGFQLQQPDWMREY